MRLWTIQNLRAWDLAASYERSHMGNFVQTYPALVGQCLIRPCDATAHVPSPSWRLRYCPQTLLLGMKGATTGGGELDFFNWPDSWFQEREKKD